MKKLDANAIRRQNLQTIFDILQQGAMTRNEIARAAGLSLMSVTNLVDQLQANGAIEISPPAAGDGTRRTGRKAEQISVAAAQPRWMVINLTDRHFRYVLLRADRKIAHQSALWPYDQALSYAENLRRFLRAGAEDGRIRIDGLSAVAVVLPGPFDAELDQVTNIRIPEMNDLHIREMVREAFGDVYTYLDEDVKFAVRAYAGLHPQMKSLYYLYIGEGIGGAMTYDGQVLYGLNSVMGDPGQLKTGETGSFEQRASLRTFLRRLFGSGADGMNAVQAEEAVRLLAKERAEEYAAALEDAAKVVAEILHLAAWLMDPHAVVIDCGYARPMEAKFLAAVSDALAQYGDLRRLPQLCPLQTDIDAPYFGAVKALEKRWMATMK